MSTQDNPTLHQLYDAITVGSKRFSGIVGDANHAATGGYHIGRDYLSRADYSAGQTGNNASPRDRGGSGQVACAIDVSFNPADMAAVTNRLLAACGTNAMRGVREFNGTVNGVTTLNRDAVLGWRQNYTPDPTHLWHVHIGFFRDTAQDWNTIADVAFVINGGLATATGNATPLSEEDELMAARDDILAAIQALGTQMHAENDGTQKMIGTVSEQVAGVDGRVHTENTGTQQLILGIGKGTTDPAAIAASIIAAIPTDIAKQVVDELGKRLAA